jgi:hypothetical protein
VQPLTPQPRDGDLAPASPPWTPQAHQRALMLRRRCPHCAEQVAASLLLRHSACLECGLALDWPQVTDALSIGQTLLEGWRRRRWWVYGGVVLATGLTGFLPVVPTLLAVIAMIILRYGLMREPLGWFSPARRLTSRLVLGQWLALTSLLALGLNVLCSLVPAASVVLNAIACLGATALFVEVSLLYLRGRLEREVEHGAKLQVWEWALPLVLIVGVAVVAAASAVAIALLIQWADRAMSLLAHPPL